MTLATSAMLANELKEQKVAPDDTIQVMLLLWVVMSFVKDRIAIKRNKQEMWVNPAFFVNTSTI